MNFNQFKVTTIILAFICMGFTMEAQKFGYLNSALLLSELSEFTSRNDGWKNLLIYGAVFLGINLIVGIIMFWKYLRILIKMADDNLKKVNSNSDTQ